MPVSLSTMGAAPPARAKREPAVPLGLRADGEPPPARASTVGSSGLYRRDLAPSRHGPLGAATQRPRGFCYGADETDNAPSPSTAWYSAWLSLNDRGQVIYRFKQPFRDGTTHVVLDPMDFIARLAALVPRPRLNLTRFHGVFAPNCKHRKSVVPKRKPNEEQPNKPLAPMTWTQRLKRVFSIDIETCPKCGGKLRVIACIEDPDIIAKILEHIRTRDESQPFTTASAATAHRAPDLSTPGQALLTRKDRLTATCAADYKIGSSFVPIAPAQHTHTHAERLKPRSTRTDSAWRYSPI